MARLPYVIGYDPSFLGNNFSVPLPTLNCRGCLVNSGEVLDYIHFSLVMHADRKSALFTAHNIDADQRKSVDRDNWEFDKRIDSSFQTGNTPYSGTPYDRGHLVRRAAVAWGSRQESQDASDSTFFYTNAALQHENFNQDEWLDLENWVLESATDISSRLCVFTGPLYTKMDPTVKGYRVPSAFWKVAVLLDPTASGNDLSAIGFLMKQNEFWQDKNGAPIEDFQIYQVSISELGQYTGINFGNLVSIDEFMWRFPRFRDGRPQAPVRINGPEDIKFFGNRKRAAGVSWIQQGFRFNGTPKPQNKRGCGCKEKTHNLEASIQILRKEIIDLREILELTLLGLNDHNEESRMRNLRAAQNRFMRIVGGKQVLAKDFLECACIGNIHGWFCSGILIHPRVVLTAAHCAPNIQQVYLGGNNINLSGIIGEVLQVEEVIVHPDYSENIVPSNDIAVLILKEPSQNIPIEIATRKEVDNENNVSLVGFGYEDPVLEIGFGIKRVVDVPLTNFLGLDETIIMKSENIFGYSYSREFHAGAKNLGKDSCNGDSGGPAYLISRNENDEILIKLAGITSRAASSYEEPCGDGGIYTRITPYLEWINEVTQGITSFTRDVNEPELEVKELYISAAFPNPQNPETGKEWIRLKNDSKVSVSLTPYFLRDRAGKSFDLPGSISSESIENIFLPSNFILNNSSEDIILLKDGVEIHRVSYQNAVEGEIIHFDRPDESGGGNGGQNGGNNDGCVPPTNIVEADPC